MDINDRFEQFKLLIDDIRAQMRDYPELNELIQDVESSDLMIAKTIKFIVDYFNGMTPILSINYSWNNMPRHLLILGTIARLQFQVVDLDERNYYPGADGRVSVPSRQKGQLVKASAMQKWNEFLSLAREFKVAQNYASAFPGRALASEADTFPIDYYIKLLSQELPSS